MCVYMSFCCYMYIYILDILNVNYFTLGNLIKRTQWHRITSWNSADWLPEKVKKG